MNEESAGGPITEPTPAQLWDLLRQAPVGRVAVIVDSHPEIFPVNHVVDHATVVFRTSRDSVLAHSAGSPASYQADGHDLATGEAWSVMVKGRLREVSGLYDGLEASGLPLTPWQPGNKPRIMRLEPHELTGRRFPVVQHRGG